MELERCCGNLAGRPKPQNRVPALEGTNNGIHRLLWPRDFQQLPEGSRSFSSPSLSLLCCSDAVHSALSGLTGITAFYLRVYLSLLMRVGNFSVLSCRHLGLPPCPFILLCTFNFWSTLFFFFLRNYFQHFLQGRSAVNKFLWFVLV